MSQLRRRMMAQHRAADNAIYDNYLTIEALEDGLTAQLSVNACEYCVDGDGAWKSLAAATATAAINKGQYLSFRATGLTPTSSSGIGKFTISKKCNLRGDLMSMLYGDDAPNQYALGKNYAFYNLFASNKTIIDASRLRMKATTLTQYCYYYTFNGCSNLVSAPEFEATTVANYACYYMYYNCTSLKNGPSVLPAVTAKTRCYSCMFRGCTALAVAPKIMLTTLADNCCTAMFYGCTSLTTAPKLYAKTLVSACYGSMFYGCSKLSKVEALFTTTPSDTYTKTWLYGVASSGTFAKASDATWNVTGDNGVPSGWDVITAYDGYSMLDYVETNGYQKIGVRLPDNLSIDSSCTIIADVQATSTPSANDWMLTIIPYSNSNNPGVGVLYNGGWKYSVQGYNESYSAAATDKLNIIAGNKSCTINEETKIINAAVSVGSSSVITLCYNAGLSTRGMKARIYHLLIMGDVMLDCNPVERDSDGARGLYDATYDMFFPLESI